VAEAQDAHAAEPGPYYKFRVTRLAYFLWFLCVLVVALMVAISLVILAQGAAAPRVATPWSKWAAQNSKDLLNLITSIATVIGFVLSIGRFHDIGHSGWWSLLLLVPVVNLIVWAYLLFAPSAVRKEAQLALQFPRPMEPPRAERVAAMTNARGWMILAGFIISCLLVASAVVLFATYYVAA